MNTLVITLRCQDGAKLARLVRDGRAGPRHRDDMPGIPTSDALMALFWHTAYFMTGVSICTSSSPLSRSDMSGSESSQP